MHAYPTRRRLHWHPASVVAAFSVWMICSGLNPVPLAAVDAPVAGWRSDSLKASDSWNTLTVDMAVRRKHVKADGTATGALSPAVSYRIERSKRSGSWKTVMTVLSMERSPVYSLDGLVGSPSPLSVARIEDDENGTPVRAYDSLGRQLELPQIAASSRATLASLVENSSAGTASTGASWSRRPLLSNAAAQMKDGVSVDNFIATGADRKVRLQAFERRFGRASSVKGLSRFSKTTGDLVEEVLVDPQAIVPVENNVVSNATLVSHRTFAYGAAYADALVRTGVHSEHLIAPSTGERAVVDTTFTNISLTRR